MQTDLEWWLMKTTNEIKTQINVCIAGVAAQKIADDIQFSLPEITLDPFNDAAFFYGDFGHRVTNYSRFMLFSWGTKLDLTVAAQGSERVSLSIKMYIHDTFGTDAEKQARTLLRYRKALKASIRHAYSKMGHHGLEVISLPDGLFQVSNRHMWVIPMIIEWSIA